MTTPQDHQSAFGRFLSELTRRHVVRFSIGYAAAAFVLLQLVEIVFPAFGIGETGLRVLVIAVVLLFPPAVVLAWLFDLTPEGIRRTKAVDDEGHRIAPLTPRLALLAVTIVVVGALTLWLAKGGAFTAPPVGEGSGDVAPALTKFDPHQPIHSVAVLPLENISATGEQDYFSSGLHEELIAQLSQLSGLRVVSRTSVMRYLGTTTPVPTIGKELQVDAIIEGSVRRDSTRVRITVQLIHAASDTHIWTKQYDRDLKDVLSLESEVAQEIATEVRAEVTPEERRRFTRTASTTLDPVVQEAYLRGRYAYDRGTPDGYRSAMHHFQEALSRDSTFAPAMAGLAGARFLLGLSDPSAPEADPDLAQKEAQQAVALDSLSSEAREVAALIQVNLPSVKSAPAAKTAPGVTVKIPTTVGAPGLDSIPGPPVLDTAWVAAMTQLGRRIEEQVRHQTSEAERQGRVSQVLAARQLTVSGNFRDAVGVLHGLVASNPDFDPGWEQLARAQLASGEVDSTVATLDQWQAAGGKGAPTAEELTALRAAVKANGVKGYWTWALQRMEQRKAQGQHVSRAELAAAYAALGRTEDAFAVLEEGVSQGDRGLLMLDADPVFDPLRSDPRFAEILGKVRALRFTAGHRPPGTPGGRIPSGPQRDGRR
jgi:TolB-like protein/tetratricopeptide (TPR) repeat protein